MKIFWLLIATITGMVFASFTNGDAVVNGSIVHLGGPAVGTTNSFDGDIISSIDHIRFTVNTSGLISMDLLSWEHDSSGNGQDVNGDGEIAFLDPFIYLFNDDGSLDPGDLISSNDDSFSTFGDGSISNLDSFLSLNLTAGDYILTVGGYNYTDLEAIAGLNPGTGSGYYPVTMGANPFEYLVHDHGHYRVTFTGDVTVSVPERGATAVLSLSGLAFSTVTRRRRSPVAS